MRGITILMVWLFLPITALAESVAVLPVTYKIYRTNKASQERAVKVKEAVVRGVENAGFTPMTGADIDQESESLASPNEKYCLSSECTLKVAEKVGADLGVLVWISDQDGQFDIQIITTHAEPIAKSPFGTLKSITKRIEALVSDSLKEAARNLPKAEANPGQTTQDTSDEKTDEEAAAGVEPEDEETEPDTTTDETVMPPAPVVSKKKPFDPPVFWSLFGVTAAVGVGYGISETIGFVKKKGTDNPSSSDKKKLESWQLANRITLGITAAGVIATGVIAFFTNFGSAAETSRNRNLKLAGPSESLRKVAKASLDIKLAPALDPAGASAGLALSGAF